MYACWNTRAVGLNLPALESLELAARAGFRGVDLMVRDLVDAKEDPRRLRARMDRLGLQGGAWPLPVTWRGDAKTFNRDLQRLPRYAEAAAALGLSRTGTWVMPETPGRPDPGDNESSYLASVADLHVERLVAMAGVLAEYGVRLGLEVIGVESSRTGRGLPFVTRMAELSDLLERVSAGSANVGVLIDSFHLYAAGEEPAAGLAWGADRVVLVHLADVPAANRADRATLLDHDRGLPGEQETIANRTLLRMLDASGYDGPVTVEPMAGCRDLNGLNPLEIAHRVAAAVHSVWPGRDRTN